MTSLSKAGRPPAAPKFALDLPAQRQRYTEKDQFVVVALWLAGFSASAISRTYGFRRSQILGIVHRSGFEARSSMTDQQRQAELNLLKDLRIDDDSGVPLDRGDLKNFDWRIMPIEDGRKRRPARRTEAS
jgi:hypothetical protein